MRGPRALLALGLAAATGCAAPPPDGVRPAPRPEAFTVCHGHGCEQRTRVSLAPAEWARVEALFRPLPRDAAAERRAVACAIGLLERLVGPSTGTAGDLGGTFPGLGRPGQMDCVDEATNTGTYLRMLADAGLLRFHVPDGRATRGYFVAGWPHTTAVMRERATGRRWAVDSWFENNGRPARVVPLGRWRRGWRPSPDEPPPACAPATP
ncbi:MAG TPA: hypothetical protein ENK20_00635 [Chromatiales bacterium]|nr:hypothetical protein [Chromatiales bacterium]